MVWNFGIFFLISISLAHTFSFAGLLAVCWRLYSVHFHWITFIFGGFQILPCGPNFWTPAFAFQWFKIKHKYELFQPCHLTLGTAFFLKSAVSKIQSKIQIRGKNQIIWLCNLLDFSVNIKKQTVCSLMSHSLFPKLVYCIFIKVVTLTDIADTKTCVSWVYKWVVLMFTRRFCL